MFARIRDTLLAIKEDMWGKHRWLSLILIVVILVGFVFVAIKGYKAIDHHYNYSQTEFHFEEGNKTVDIKVEYPEKHSILYVNGKRKEKISSIAHTPNPVMVLPTKEGVLDIVTERKPTSDLSWDSSLEESVMYLNFLENMGYKQVREVQTSQYVEKIVELNGVKRRIIIFTNIIMVGDLNKGVKLPSSEELIKKYRK